MMPQNYFLSKCDITIFSQWVPSSILAAEQSDIMLYMVMLHFD